MPTPDPGRIVACADADAFGEWLATHHAEWPEVWLKLTKGSGLTWEQAVIEALAWGWIDGVKRSDGASHWLQRFTPRRPRSAWSQKNCGHATRLIAEGRMQPPGLAVVNAAKADGRWDAAYSTSTFDMPDDFLAELARSTSAAQAHFAALNRQNRFAIYYRLTSAKRPETRTKRVALFVAMMERGERFYG